MALVLPYDASGLDGKLRMVIDDIVGRIQIWAGKVDGINQAGIATAVVTGAGFLWFTNTAPSGYLLCDGSEVDRGTYSPLFALWGTTYGAGDGSTTFNLPDLRQRFPLGKATSGTGSTLGATGGAIDHTHGVGTLAGDAFLGSPIGVEDNPIGVLVEPNGHEHPVTGNTGTANPPYQVVNYIVKV